MSEAKKVVVDLENLTSTTTALNSQSPSKLINNDLDLSSTTSCLPEIFSDYYFHTGPLRADPPPVCEWPERIPDNHATIKNKKKYKEKLTDFTILAESCRRAGKHRQYANCYMAMGIIYDNCKDYKHAVSSYKKFVDILTKSVIIPSQSTSTIADKESDISIRAPIHKSQSMASTNTIEFDLGLYAAYNALGVDYQLLGDMVSSKNGNHDKNEENMPSDDDRKCIKHFKKSLEYHLKYRDCIMETESNVMNDTNCNSALFIAYTNIGLLLLRCDRVKFAINQFQHALRYSIHINSNIAQSIAICNISLANVCHKEYSIGRCCMERYLQLVTVLGDVQSQCYAFYNLGTMIVQWVQHEMDKPKEEKKEKDNSDPNSNDKEAFIKEEVKRTRIVERKNVTDAIYFLEEAIKVCQYIGDKQLQNQLKMKLAVSTVLGTQL